MHAAGIVEQRRFGTSGRLVAVIGQGTWNADRSDRASAIAALRLGVELGLTHIDTAEMHGGAEELVGEALASRRDDIFLVSKFLPEHASRRGTIDACERTLLRLRTD
ncbi:MAG: aldo/keto reductase, partial [Candidatus Binatia bacterium]